MKKLSIIHFLGLALFAMTFNACVEDPGPGTGGGGGGIFAETPELSIVDEAGFIAFDSTIDAGSNFNVKVSVTQGDSPLQAFYLQEDGIEIASARFLVNGEDSGANPKLIVGADKEGLTWELTILGHEVGTKQYRFLVEDEAGETSSQVLNITADDGTPPTVIVGGSGMFMADPGNLVSIPLTVGQGTFLLSSIAVYENDVLIEDFANRLFYDDLGNPFDGNPYILPTADQNGLDKTIFVRAAADAGVNTYRIVVADELGNVTESSFDITTGVSGTPVTSIQGVLFNSAGPAGTGGLDLDAGEGTGSSDGAAEIKDEGIDTSVGNDINWIKNISGVNGTELRLMVPNTGGVSENFKYEDIVVSEQIDDLLGAGTPFQNTNANGDLVSWLVEVGDVFYAQGTNNNYLFIIREVNETPDNNGDNYVIDIKY